MADLSPRRWEILARLAGPPPARFWRQVAGIAAEPAQSHEVCLTARWHVEGPAMTSPDALIDVLILLGLVVLIAAWCWKVLR